MAYQSLYRRYRPQKFSEIRGQTHVVRALRNAVANNQVGHAYLFHGPRGTGKTTSARVLAKALNCTQLADDSEPCGTCDSCVAIEQGRSFDLHELDAASNNGVEDMRDLLSKVNLGNPGEMKVYILDEVHMLTRGAENSLLKTLEEPPAHVVWVLATTEPHKVVETIRSRCQVFELRLLGAQDMTEHVRWVVKDAGLDVDDNAVDYAVSVGGGSVRDTLSALDRVVAAGGVTDVDDTTDQLLQALADQDTAMALQAIGDALGRGRDPRTIGEMLLAGLRDAFLTLMGSPPPHSTAPQQQRAANIAEAMSAPQLTRALETLGEALVDMRQAPDPRVQLEVAVVRLTRSATNASTESLLARIERLEAQLAASNAQRPTAKSVAGRPTPGAKPPPPAPPPPTPPPPLPSPSGQATDQTDIRSIQPTSPRHVVQLAAEYLGLAPLIVSSKGKSFFGGTKEKHSPEDLHRFWIALLNQFGTNAIRATPAPSATQQRVPAPDDSGTPDHRPTSKESSTQTENPHQQGNARNDNAPPHDNTPPHDNAAVADDKPVDDNASAPGAESVAGNTSALEAESAHQPHPDEHSNISLHPDELQEEVLETFPGTEVKPPPETPPTR